jgi:repressor LexA
MSEEKQELTDRQREVLEIIRASITDRSYPPTVREIAEKIGVQITAVVGHLDALERKGWIRRIDGAARAITVL